jgi:hypothetical protein
MSITKAREQVVRELHKPARLKFKRRRFIHRGLDDTFASDLAQLDQYTRENRGFKYILVVIDCFSKFLWTKPLKSKTGQEITKAMALIFKQSKRIPKNLVTDNGKEYYNSGFQNLMKQHGINHYSTFSILKASIAERVIRTIKEKLFRLFTLNGNHKWIDLLDQVTHNYNNSKHRTIGMKPKDVNKSNEQSILKSVYSHLKIVASQKFKVGDVVRISKAKHIFQKGYTPNWTTELFKISKVKITNPTTYLLEDMQGHPIKGGFYEVELQKTKQPDVFLIESVLRRKGNKMYVKWLGFDNSHNSWIDVNKDVV